ncbi:hypothetical protein M433DRAFT_28299 [Acidomyces richmondensis BFW]|nr:hypothetical protein M433DRAFT_28299 [Acidomyces richmondensis BFW]
MSYNKHRHERLQRLGIQQLPAILLRQGWSQPHLRLDTDLPIRTMPVRAGPSVSKLFGQGANRVGHSGQALSLLRYGSQLIEL